MAYLAEKKESKWVRGILRKDILYWLMNQEEEEDMLLKAIHFRN